MGVMACDRSGCENVLCDRYNEDFGYICEDCYSELEYLTPTNVDEIRRFMCGSQYSPEEGLDLSLIFKEV